MGNERNGRYPRLNRGPCDSPGVVSNVEGLVEGTLENHGVFILLAREVDYRDNCFVGASVARPYCRYLVRFPQLAHMFLGKIRDGNIGKGTHGIDSSSMLGGRARRTKVGHIRSETRGDMKHSQKHFDVCKVLQYLRGHIPLRVIQDAVLGVSVSLRCETWRDS